MEEKPTLARARALLARMLPERANNGRDVAEAVAAALRAADGPITMLELDVHPDAPKMSVTDGPMTGFYVVDERGKLDGELVLWIADGRPSALEYAWYTDERPADLPEPGLLLVDASDSTGHASAAASVGALAEPPSGLRLTEETVALLMRLLISGQIARPVACQFVAPWVEGDLPSSGLAHSGAQTVHGLDLVGDGAGLVWHAPALSDDHDFIFSRYEMVFRCKQWLESYRLANQPE